MSVNWVLSNPTMLKVVENTLGPFATVQRLTRSVKEKLGSQYRFQWLNQAWRDLASEEVILLERSGKAWVRSVSHEREEEVVVEGFSIVPEDTYQILSEKLDLLGGKPIGDALLFENPQVTRSSFYYRKMGEHWERASLFFYAHDEKIYPLMVVERFVGKL